MGTVVSKHLERGMERGQVAAVLLWQPLILARPEEHEALS
jgi:hypothetical protein